MGLPIPPHFWLLPTVALLRLLITLHSGYYLHLMGLSCVGKYVLVQWYITLFLLGLAES
jgi:hypothetical protein